MKEGSVKMAARSLIQDPSLHRPPPRGFQCWESVDDEGEVGSVVFLCARPCGPIASNPPPDGKKLPPSLLRFSCRKRSVGVLARDEKAVRDEDIEEAAYEAVDANFFDQGYTLAGATGFQIWAGSRLLVESLAWPRDFGADPKDLVGWRNRIFGGARVLELGAGIGLAGASLAAAGAEVLLTDLPTLVENATHPNLLLNEYEDAERVLGGEAAFIGGSENRTQPEWLSPANAVPIGRGWGGTMALDWMHPVEEQLSSEQRKGIDIIVASDCVWLVQMLTTLLDTVASIFESSSKRSPSLLMSFQRRDAGDGDDSPTFTTVTRVLEAVAARNWSITSLAWRTVNVDGQDCEKEVFLFEIKPERQFEEA